MSHSTPDPVNRVVTRYERLAHDYDRQWRSYTQRSLNRLLGVLTLTGTERVLDLGCGTGEFERLAIERFPRLTIVGVDVTPAMAAAARAKLQQFPNIEVRVSPVEALPFGAEEFDVVVSASMLHHLSDVRLVLQEALRVLRPGGQLALLDWCRDFWRCRLLHAWLRLVDPTYGRMYRLGELCALLEQHGLLIQSADRFVVPPGYGLLCVKGLKR